MSLTAYLQFGNNEIGKYSKEYMLKDVKCHFIRNHDAVRPTEDAFCESIELSIFVPGKEDLMLIEWFANAELQSGRILVEESDPRREEEHKWHQILFEDALCFSLREDFRQDDKRRVLYLSIMAHRIQADGVNFIR